MVDVAKLRILVEADASSVPKAFAVATTATQSWSTAMSGAMARVSQAGQQLTGFWSSLSTGQKTLAGFGIGAALVGTAFKAVIGPAIEFESAFAGVRKTVDGTPAQLESIRSGLLSMSQVMPTAANDLADIAANAGQLGVEAPGILEFTRVIAQLGETTDLSFDAAAQSLARFLNITGNDKSITQIADVIVELGNNSATTESQIVTFATRLASAFTVAGASEDQILALAASFSSLGVEAEAGGSSLSMIITSISDAAKGGNDYLDVFSRTAGVLPEQFRQIALSNPVEAMLLFGEGLGRVSAQGRSISPILDEIGLGGIRTSRVMELLALNTDQVRTSLGLANAQMTEGGAAQEEYDKRVETTASRLAIFQQRLTGLAIALGTPALAGFARLVDSAGDAIAGVAEALAPLAVSLAEVFGNGARAAGVFWSAVGSPLAQLAVGSLSAAALALAQMLEVLAALGPAGVAVPLLLADLALVGPVTSRAVLAIDGMAAALFRVSGAATGASFSMQALNVAVAAGPWIALIALLAATGKAFHDANEAADESGAAFTKGIDEAVKSGSWLQLQTQVAQTRARMAELNEEGFREDRLSRYGLAIKGLGQIITPFTENTIVNARAELRELDRLAAENHWDQYESNLRGVASVSGLTEAAVIRLASEMGLLDAILRGSPEEYGAARAAIKATAEEHRELADAIGSTTGAMLDSSTTASSLASALGLSEAALKRVGERMQDFNWNDLSDENPDVRLAAMSALVGEVESGYEALAGQLGETTGEFEAQVAAVEALAASHSNLRKAIEGAQDAMAVMGEQQRIAAEARETYLEAFDNAKDVDSFREAAMAAKDYVLEIAGTGVGIREVTQLQAELGRSLIEHGVNSLHLTRDAAIEAAASLLGLPRETLLRIIAEADKAQADMDAIAENAQELADSEFRVKVGIDALEGEERIGALKLQLGDVTDREWLAHLNVESLEGAERIGAMKLQMTDFVGGDYTAQVKADTDPATQAMAEVLEFIRTAFAGATHEAKLTADNTDAVNKAQIAGSTASAFAQGTYIAPLRGDNSNLLSSAAVASNIATGFASAAYIAQLRANNSDATSKSSAATSAAQAFVREYRATLAATDNASSTIWGAVRALGSFVSKTISLTTVTRTVRNPDQAATGGIWTGPVQVFETGGFSLAGAVLERPGPATIYPAATPGRFFAEPVTGGEVFIPLRGDPGRNFAIWSMAGQMMGFLASGGIVLDSLLRSVPGQIESARSAAGRGGISIDARVHAPISVQIYASPGMDEARVAELAGRRIDEALRATARDFRNIRGLGVL